VEFVPWTRIPTLEAAWEIVRTADRPNGGILFDNLHWFRGGGSFAAMAAVPAERILAVQLSDVPAAAPPDLVGEALGGRLLPGEGDTGIVDLLRWMDANRWNVPLGVEVFSQELAALPSNEAVDRMGHALRRVVDEATS
jgi:sugar phosphate isomerase/epimerase